MSRDSRDIDTERVIEEVKLRSCLWDANHPKHRCKEMRATAWDEVVIAIFGDISEYEKDNRLRMIQQRWKTARDAFFRTKSYMKFNSESRKKFKKYIYYDELCFLTPNEANEVIEEIETNQNLEVAGSSEVQHTKVRIMSADVLKPRKAQKRKIKEHHHISQPKNDPLSDSQLNNDPLSDSEPEDEPQKENGFEKELLKLLRSQTCKITSDDLFFFMSMASVLNTFDFHQKIVFRSKVLAAAAEVQKIYNGPNRSASESSTVPDTESPEEFNLKVELQETPFET